MAAVKPLSVVKNIDDPSAFTGLVGGEGEGRNVRYGVKLCGKGLLTPKDVVSEIVNNFAVFGLPNTDKWISGLINLRGNIVPIFDLMSHPDFHQGDAPKTAGNKDKELLIIGQGEDAVGVMVDGYPKTLDLDGDDVEFRDEVDEQELGETFGALASHALKSVKVDQEVYYEIDYDAFFSELSGAYSDSVAVAG